METKLSLSTITLCIASLENLKKKMQDSIDYYQKITLQTPSWMLDIRQDYVDAIDELKKSIAL